MWQKSFDLIILPFTDTVPHPSLHLSTPHLSRRCTFLARPAASLSASVFPTPTVYLTHPPPPDVALVGADGCHRGPCHVVHGPRRHYRHEDGAGRGAARALRPLPVAPHEWLPGANPSTALRECPDAYDGAALPLTLSLTRLPRGLRGRLRAPVSTYSTRWSATRPATGPRPPTYPYP